MNFFSVEPLILTDLPLVKVSTSAGNESLILDGDEETFLLFDQADSHIRINFKKTVEIQFIRIMMQNKKSNVIVKFGPSSNKNSYVNPICRIIAIFDDAFQWRYIECKPSYKKFLGQFLHLLPSQKESFIIRELQVIGNEV